MAIGPDQQKYLDRQSPPIRWILTQVATNPRVEAAFVGASWGLIDATAIITGYYPQFFILFSLLLSAGMTLNHRNRLQSKK